jgi:hypothetical protein
MYGIFALCVFSGSDYTENHICEENPIVLAGGSGLRISAIVEKSSRIRSEFVQPLAGWRFGDSIATPGVDYVCSSCSVAGHELRRGGSSVFLGYRLKT